MTFVAICKDKIYDIYYGVHNSCKDILTVSSLARQSCRAPIFSTPAAILETIRIYCTVVQKPGRIEMMMLYHLSRCISTINGYDS